MGYLEYSNKTMLQNEAGVERDLHVEAAMGHTA